MIKKYEQIKSQLKDFQIPFPQNDFEFFEYCKFLSYTFHEQCINYLEIGSRHGGSLYVASKHLRKGSKIISIDLPNSNWGIENSEISLNNVKTILINEGYNCEIIYGNSLHDTTFEKVLSILDGSKIDVIFYDGDHSYDGISGDVKKYSSLLDKNGYSVFHDIVKKDNLPRVEVWKLWEQLIKQGNSIQFISEYGIGIFKTN
jgi:cephalosporin hydroxylase